MWARLLNKLRYLIGGGRIDRELARELEFHQAMLSRDLEERGYSSEAASLGARRRMGNTPLMIEYAREAWLIGWLDTLRRDLRYALRSFRRHPGFTAAALLSLSLGIGANTAIFTLVDAVLLRDLPVAHAKDLLVVSNRTFSYWQFEQLRDRNEVFEAVSGVRTVSNVTLSQDRADLGQVSASLVSGNYFAVLGVKPALGRAITPDDDRAAGEGRVAVISHGLWQRLFGGAPDVLGRTIRLRGGRAGGGTSGFEPELDPSMPTEALVTIVGIAPPGFFGETLGTVADVWIPITMQPVLMPGRAWLTRRTAVWVNILGRRRAPVTDAQATEALTLLWRQVQTEEAGAVPSDQQQRAIASSRLAVEAGDKGFPQLRREFAQPLLVLMGVVTCVLLIACLNVANLLLARGTARRQEVLMRLSLGAGRARVMRQLLTESLLLAVAGGALGLGLAMVGTRVLVGLVAADTGDIALQLAPDPRILAFTAAVTLASGLLFGLVPALRGTQRALRQTIRQESWSAGAVRSRAGQVLVALQIATSLVLLVGCGLFLRTLHNLKTEELGYDPTGLVLARLDPVAAGYRGDDIGRASVALMHRLAALPGVASVTFSENGLFSGSESTARIDIDISAVSPASDDDRRAHFDQVGPGYFTNVGIRLVLGRDFTERDRPGAPRVAIVNETMARFYFPDGGAIGRRILFGPGEPGLEIVGVARDAVDHDLRAGPVRRFYVPYLQPIDGITGVNFEIRARAGVEPLLGAIRAEVPAFDPKLPLLSLKTSRALVDESIGVERLLAKLSAFFGTVALLLAAIGIYGVMAYTVARRTAEIGLRLALGASRRAVAVMVLREILGLLGAGSLVGAVASLGLGTLTSSLLFGLAPRDPSTLAAGVGTLLVAGLLAGFLPARRAASVDPIIALRAE